MVRYLFHFFMVMTAIALFLPAKAFPRLNDGWQWTLEGRQSPGTVFIDCSYATDEGLQYLKSEDGGDAVLDGMLVNGKDRCKIGSRRRAEHEKFCRDMEQPPQLHLVTGGATAAAECGKFEHNYQLIACLHDKAVRSGQYATFLSIYEHFDWPEGCGVVLPATVKGKGHAGERRLEYSKDKKKASLEPLFKPLLKLPIKLAPLLVSLKWACQAQYNHGIRQYASRTSEGTCLSIRDSDLAPFDEELIYLMKDPDTDAYLEALRLQAISRLAMNYRAIGGADLKDPPKSCDRFAIGFAKLAKQPLPREIQVAYEGIDSPFYRQALRKAAKEVLAVQSMIGEITDYFAYCENKEATAALSTLSDIYQIARNGRIKKPCGKALLDKLQKEKTAGEAVILAYYEAFPFVGADHGNDVGKRDDESFVAKFAKADDTQLSAVFERARAVILGKYRALVGNFCDSDKVPWQTLVQLDGVTSAVTAHGRFEEMGQLQACLKEVVAYDQDKRSLLTMSLFGGLCAIGLVAPPTSLSAELVCTAAFTADAAHDFIKKRKELRWVSDCELAGGGSICSAADFLKVRAEFDAATENLIAGSALNALSFGVVARANLSRILNAAPVKLTTAELADYSQRLRATHTEASLSEVLEELRIKAGLGEDARVVSSVVARDPRGIALSLEPFYPGAATLVDARDILALERFDAELAIIRKANPVRAERLRVQAGAALTRMVCPL